MPENRPFDHNLAVAVTETIAKLQEGKPFDEVREQGDAVNAKLVEIRKQVAKASAEKRSILMNALLDALNKTTDEGARKRLQKFIRETFPETEAKA